MASGILSRRAKERADCNSLPVASFGAAHLTPGVQDPHALKRTDLSAGRGYWLLE
jgi:hypothetical protein